MQRLAEIQVSAEELGAARAGDSAARRALFERVAPGTLAHHPAPGAPQTRWPTTCFRTR